MGFPIPPKQIQKAKFKSNDIHKKFGQIIVIPEGPEGPMKTQIYLVTEDKCVLTWWLLKEEREE